MTVNFEAVEEFIINDIEMGLSPSDVLYFDDNYITPQSFLRSNSVYCFRSKYSNTRIVLTFPFSIKSNAPADAQGMNSTSQCIKLISQLNSYPYCFIKSKRVASYVAPTVVSSSGFMMFAIEETALIQSAAASNLMFLEVTLQYFNFANVASDFSFVDVNKYLESSVGTTEEGKEVQYDQKILKEGPVLKVSSLSQSAVWSQYMKPKYDKVVDQLEVSGMLKSFQDNHFNDHPGLSVGLFFPVIYSNADRGSRMLQDSDGMFVNPYAKVIYTTNISKLDSDALPDMLIKYLNQNFTEDADGLIDDNGEAYDKDEKALVKEMYAQYLDDRALVGDNYSSPYKRVTKTPAETAALLKKAEQYGINENNIETADNLSGKEELLVSYAAINMDSLGFNINKIEVRQRNNLVSHKIGMYKHPFIQYMGREPARTTIEIVSDSSTSYKQDQGINAVLTNSLNILDRNRAEHPAAEAYNTIKIVSLAHILMGCDSAVPNQNSLSASADRAGIETNTLTLMETNTEEFISQFRINASGANSIDKARDQLESIVLQWLSKFKEDTKGGSIEGIGDPSSTDFASSRNIYQSLINLAEEASKDIGWGEENEVKIFTTGMRASNSYFNPNANGLTISMHKMQSPFSGMTVYLDQKGAVEEVVSAAEVVENYGTIMGAPPLAVQKVVEGTSAISLSAVTYFWWLSTYMHSVIKARSLLDKGTNVNLNNIKYRPGYRYDTYLQNAATLIGALSDSKQYSALTEGQKVFLDNYLDLYDGSLFGQNLPDLYLDDLKSNYDPKTDMLVQNTDPFFFIETSNVLGTEMIEFYNQAYQEEDLDPSIPQVLEEDGEKEPALSTISEGLLGVTYMTLEEVNFNPEFDKNLDNYVNGAADGTSTIVVNGATLSIPGKAKPNTITPEAAKAIENALAKYGLSGDTAFRNYMYKVAIIESGGGTVLVNTAGSGAKGLFQFTEVAIQEIMMRDNTVFKSTGQVNLSKAKAVTEAKKLKDTQNFAQDHQLNAYMFIELHNIHMKYYNKGGKFNEALSYGYHNIGPGTMKYVKTYLEKGIHDNPAAGTEASKAFIKNGAPANGRQAETWYKLMSSKLSAVKGVTLTNGDPVPKSIASTAPQTPTTEKSSATPARIEIRWGQQVKATVTKVWDGDTIDVRVVQNGKNYTTRIRFAGIDTKETSEISSKYTKEMAPWGEAAKSQTKSMLPEGTPIYVTFLDNDLRADDGSVNRLVADVRTMIGLDPAAALLEKGLAETTPSMGTTTQKYQELQKEAQRKKVGIWSGGQPAKETPKETTVQTKERIDAAVMMRGARNSKVALPNVWQPFADGKIREVRSVFTFGEDRTDIKGYKGPHKGLDFRCDVGTSVIAAAAGICTVRTQTDKSGKESGAGLYVTIDHQNGFVTKYMHLSEASVKTGQKVAYKTPIGLSGGAAGAKGSGTSTGPHLHYQVEFKGTPIHPYSTPKQLHAYTGGEVYDSGTGQAYSDPIKYYDISDRFSARSGITPENTVFNEDKLATAILENARKQANIGLKAAIPAIKAYIIIGNENDGFGLDTSVAGAQYYELKGIQSFKLACNDDTNPVDLALMRIVDPSFANTDSWTNLMKVPSIDYNNVGTDYEMQFKNDRAMIRAGTKFSIRLGYGNDPNQLRVVFNGGVTEVRNGPNQTLDLVLEGYGRELISEIKCPTEPQKLNGNTSVPTKALIGFGMVSRSIDHFGYMANHFKWLYKDNTDPEERAMVDVIDSTHFLYFTLSSAIHRSRLYMNCFAPEIEKADNSFAKYWTGLFESLGMSNRMFGYPFYVYNMTPWDICKQAEYRHPGTILKPMMFEDHMTLFYGVKEQMYFAKDLSRRTQKLARQDLKDGKQTAATTNYYERRRERMEPVSNMHFVSSSSNLISNQISINREYATSTNVAYFNDNSDFNDYYNWDNIEMFIDDNLLPWEVRQKTLKLSGCHGKYSAFVYGTTDLKKETEKMYGGKIMILGNENVKAGDYIYIDDAENRITGLALVRECIHHFDPINGFVTEITPGQYVEPSQFLYTPLWIKLMCSMRVGASKLRMNLSTEYTTEFDYIVDMYKALDQISTANEEGSNHARADILHNYIKYGTAFTFAAAVTWSLGNKLTGGKYIPGRGSVMFGVNTVRSMFGDINHMLTKKQRVALKQGKSWYRAGARDLGKAKGWVKTQIIGTDMYKKIAGKNYDKLKSFRLFKLALKGGSKARTAAMFAARVAIQAAAGTILALTISNPLTILLDIVVMLAASWAYAKAEESRYIRQPLLFFPLMRNGKPYVGGMTGAIRNSWWDSKKLEVTKLGKQISKSAALLSSNMRSKGVTDGLTLQILEGVGSSAIASTQARDSNKWLSTNRDPVTGNIIYSQKKDLTQSSIDIKDVEQKSDIESPFHTIAKNLSTAELLAEKLKEASK